MAHKLFGQSPTEDHRARELRKLNEALQQNRKLEGRLNDGHDKESTYDTEKK